jgi:hypothetical protein
MMSQGNGCTFAIDSGKNALTLVRIVEMAKLPQYS